MAGRQAFPPVFIGTHTGGNEETVCDCVNVRLYGREGKGKAWESEKVGKWENAKVARWAGREVM